MGVQVLNKDYTIISNVIGQPKANVSYVMSAVFTPPTPPDVIPNPTPDWADVVDGSNLIDGSYTYAVQQITGINTKITLQFIPFKSTGVQFYYQIKNEEPSWINGGDGQVDPSTNGFTAIDQTINIEIEPNYFISFACKGISIPPANNTLTITNESDGGTQLDIITGTFLF